LAYSVIVENPCHIVISSIDIKWILPFLLFGLYLFI